MLEPNLVQSVSLQTNDFEELQEAATDWDQNYFQMSPGQFEGGFDLTQVGSRQIYREHWSRKIRYRGTAPPGSFGFALPLDQPGTAYWIGRPARRDTVILQAPGQEAEYVSSDFWDTLVLAVPEDEARSIISALSSHDDIGEKLHGVITLRRDVADRLRRLGLDFVSQSKLVPSEEEALVARWSEKFVKHFLWELVDTLEGPHSAIEPSRPAFTVQQATDLVLSDQASGIGLVEICAHLNVSLRALHYAFQDVTGMSPATWLRRIRLNKIHKTLLRSSPDEVLIKQVAMDNGFLHLGHFSQNYKTLFGELPSDTLCKARAN